MENQFSRTELLIGKVGVEKLKNAKVAVFGIGGVGSYVVEGLTRAGVGNFILVDNDDVSITNLNRQIIALDSTLGKKKTEVLKNRFNMNSIIEVERRGNSIKESQKRKLWNFQDWQVTGLTARPGDVLQVYVDVKDGEPTPTLVYKQSVNRHGGTTTFKLSRGKNTIVIPQYDNTIHRTC